MDDKVVKEIAFANLPSNICALTKRPIVDAAVMHRDLSDWWPSDLVNMRDERICNLLIVERQARDNYYDRLKNIGVVLAFSGGLDSTTVLHWCMKIFGKVHCLIFDYGQKHSVELECAKSYLEKLSSRDDIFCGISYELVDMGVIKQMASSSLTRDDIDVDSDRKIEDMDKSIPNTFVPGRNVYFITALAQAAYRFGWRHVSLGVNVLDYSGYPDCRPEFLEPMRQALSVGVFNGKDFGVHAPLMFLNKKQIIKLGTHLGVDYSLTHSCYNGVRGGCGNCDSCKLRRAAFIEVGMVDPSIELH